MKGEIIQVRREVLAWGRRKLDPNLRERAEIIGWNLLALARDPDDMPLRRQTKANVDALAAYMRRE